MTVSKRGGDASAGPFTVSQSVIKDWRKCHMLYHYRYIQLLKRRRPKIQLIRGQIIGQCIDALAAARSKIKGHERWTDVLARYAKQYDQLFREEQEYYGDLIGDIEKIITRYQKLYSTDRFLYTKGEDGLPYELHLELEIDKGIVFTGHIDKMPRDPQGRVWDMDHKTHKKIPDAEDRLADLQQVFYVWAAPLSGYPKLAGVIWDYIRTKPPAVPELLKSGELSKRKNIDTDYETYLNAILEHELDVGDYKEILNELKPRGYMDFFQRVQLPSPPKSMVEQVVRDAVLSSQEIRQKGGTSKVRSMTFQCKQCEFFELCQAEFRGLDSEFIRKTCYETNKEPKHDHSQEEIE